MPRINLTQAQALESVVTDELKHTKALKALSGITQEQISRATGITQAAVSKQLSGHTELSLKVYLAVKMLSEGKT